MNEKEREYWQDTYDKLDKIIQNRQNFEASNKYEPYISHQTTLDYKDIHGRTLLEIAIILGDKEKVTSS